MSIKLETVQEALLELRDFHHTMTASEMQEKILSIEVAMPGFAVEHWLDDEHNCWVLVPKEPEK